MVRMIMGGVNMRSLFCSRLYALQLLLVIFCAPAAVCAESTLPEMPNVGDVINIARFGRKLSGKDFVGIQWDNPRDVYEVRVKGISRQMSESMRLEWWGSVWPANGSGGWMRLDDPWNGQWLRIEAKPELTDQGQLVFKIPPLSKEEWHRALTSDQCPDRKAPVFRHTLKVRIVTEGKDSIELSRTSNMPKQAQLIVLGSSCWRETSFDIETRLSNDGAVTSHLEITNGILVRLHSLPAPRSAEISGTKWKIRGVAGNAAGVRIRIFYADNEDLSSSDLTRATVRFGETPHSTGFSFTPQDVLSEGVIRLPSFDTVVCETSRGVTIASDPGPAANCWAKSVRRRLQERDEMTRTTAMAGIPRLSPARWAPLGAPSARQEFLVGPDGDWMISALSLNTDNGRDARRWSFKRRFGKQRQWDKLYAMLDTRQQVKFDGGDRQKKRRWLEDGHLPLIHVEWYNGPIRCHHALFTTVLLGDYDDDVVRRGDETVVLLSKIDITNTGDTPQAAILNLRYSSNLPTDLHDDGIISVQPAEAAGVAEGLFPVRGLISTDKSVAGGVDEWTTQAGNDPACSSILRWQQTLEPRQTRSIYFKTPFVELLDAKELARLRTISFEREAQNVLGYWRNRIAKGMQIDVPDDAINNLYKANIWHNVITTDRDPETGLYNQGVATVRYRVFANETVMVARSMDMRGEHIEAERFLEPMLHYQGNEPLKGRFSTKEGVFHSADQYTHGEYAMNHGFVLWGAADHYLMTRDRHYLERVAPKLVKGCDFLISERASTMDPADSPRPPIHGLCPASSLEDVVEYQYWFATNAYFHKGMKRVAQALADIDHPDAQRLEQEAEKYRRDIEANAREAATKAAVVRLKDGNFMPYVPSRVFQWQHLTEGWIREALYCALHLATGEVVSCHDPLITWMLDDLEDNIFFSSQSGYNVENHQQCWFERGAVTLQPCLLDTPIVYIARDEISAALRTFWNTYALLIYPDIQCFAEWAPRFGVGGGPIYKTSDESRFIMWLRQLLIWENGDQLWFGKATPREWLEDGKAIHIVDAPTRFGVAGMVIHSEIDRRRIRAKVYLPQRNPPAGVWLRLRHPQGLMPSRVFVNSKTIERERIIGSDIRLMPGARNTSLPVEVVAVYLEE